MKKTKQKLMYLVSKLKKLIGELERQIEWMEEKKT